MAVPRTGSTLVELVLTMVLMAVAAAVALPNLRAIHHQMSVRGAMQEVVLGLWAARTAAAARGDFATFVVDPVAGLVRVESGGDTVFARNLAARHGVSVSATRDSVTYAPTGLGYGAANTRIVIARGARADTVTTSRLGRVAW